MLREKPNYAIDDVTVSIKETLQYYLPKFNERDFWSVRVNLEVTNE